MNEKITVPSDPTPAEVRLVRESLGLSRADVCTLTGLSLSVVWRSEQPGRSVPVTQRESILASLREVADGGLDIVCFVEIDQDTAV